MAGRNNGPVSGGAVARVGSDPTQLNSRRARRSKELNAIVYSKVHGTAAAPEIETLDVGALMEQLGRDDGRLTRAAARGDTAAVAGLLQGGASPAAADVLQPGWTPLHAAVEGGYEGIVSLLLEHGADPDARDELTGCTPFLWGCYMGHKTCVSQLLAHGKGTAAWQRRHMAVDPVGRDGAQLARLMEHRDVVEVIQVHEAAVRIEAKYAGLRELAHRSRGASMRSNSMAQKQQYPIKK